VDEKQSNRTIGYLIVAIIAYYVLQMLVPFLVWGAIGLVSWRVYNEFNKQK